MWLPRRPLGQGAGAGLHVECDPGGLAETNLEPLSLESLARRGEGAGRGVEQRAENQPGVLVDQGVVAGDDLAQFGGAARVGGALKREAEGDVGAAVGARAAVDGDVLQPVARRLHQQFQVAQILVGQGDQFPGQPGFAIGPGYP